MNHYVDYLAWLEQFGKVEHLHFEDDRGLHFHCLFKTKLFKRQRDFKYAQFGWHYMACVSYNDNQWINYCRKYADRNHDLKQLYLNCVSRNYLERYSPPPDSDEPGSEKLFSGRNIKLYNVNS